MASQKKYLLVRSVWTLEVSGIRKIWAFHIDSNSQYAWKRWEKNTANQKKKKNPHISSTENQREDYQQWRLFGSKVISENSSAKNSGAKTQEQSAGLSQSIQSLQQQQQK